jgi:hypothetical protein
MPSSPIPTPCPADSDAFRQITKPSDNFDDILLHRAVSDAGRWAYGTVFVELWVWNDDRTVLFRPEAGWWVDPVFHSSSNCSATRQVRDGLTSKKCPICRLTDSAHSDFIHPPPLSAGVGLPGVLWSETRGGRRSWRGSHNSQSRRNRQRGERGTTSPVIFPTTDNTATVPTNQSARRYVVWREVKAIVNDPDQPWNPRLQVLGTLGLGWVAAVDFDKLGHLGIVVYMAREGVDLNRLQSESNEGYLMAASDLAAAAYALRKPRGRVVEERRRELQAVLRRVKARILALQRIGITFDQLLHGDTTTVAGGDGQASIDSVETRCNKFLFGKARKWIAAMMIKAYGGNVQPPPAMGWQQSAITFFGCFSTLLLLTRLNVFLMGGLGSDFAITLPYVF